MKGSCLNCRYVRNMHYPVYTIFDRISWPWLRISFELMDDSRVRITRICCFYCCRGCCNDDIRRYLFLTERFEIRFEVNQLIEEKLTRGGKKKEEEKACPFDRTPPSRSLLPSRALVHVSDSGNVIEGREETPPCHRGLCKYVCSTIR